MSTSAIILAAGRSARMGELKQLLPWRGRTLIECSLAPYLELGLPLVVVLGCEHRRIAPVLKDLPLEVVVHPEWSRGMGSTLAAGVKSLGPQVERVFIGLADMPDITPALLKALMKVQAPTVCPIHAGRRGHPVLFERTLFAELARLDGDRGARHLLSDPALVAWPSAECLKDLDTPEDYSSP
ncbi:MAG: nucleotidyltransferase family protein [Candidatus Eremiobacteraeota bacterium]|nr:nucleotidyltransferase family protein [Candidatus Eremiobacteraeota bacterium]